MLGLGNPWLKGWSLKSDAFMLHVTNTSKTAK